MTLSPKRIGLIGGLALRAGVFYYEQLFERHRQKEQRLDLMLLHADVARVLDHVKVSDRAGLGSYIGTLANQLFDGGADIVAVAAIAPHMAVTEFTTIVKGPVVNVLDSIAAGLKQRGLDRVAVFGNRAVIESNIYGAISTENAVQMKPSVVDAVHTIYNDIALFGKQGTKDEVEFLESQARQLFEEQGAQAIILAGTDLSSFYANREPSYPFLDVAQLHIDQIMALATDE